jgi:hypothetical protein
LRRVVETLCMRVIGRQSHGVRAPVVENEMWDNLGPVMLVKSSNK